MRKFLIQTYNLNPFLMTKMKDVMKKHNISCKFISFQDLDTYLIENKIEDETFIKGSIMFLNKIKEKYPNNHSFSLLANNGNFEWLLNTIDRNLLFNDDYYITSCDELDFSYPKFIRPIEDSKSFEAKIYYENPKINENIVACEPKEIISEYRFFIVNNEIVSYSSYKYKNDYNIEIIVSNEIIQFIQKIVETYDFGLAYTLDIAKNNEKYGILELNTILGSSFYNANIENIFLTLNEL